MKTPATYELDKCRFPIDFIQFSFLVEATIPPAPIARAMFWQDVIDVHYHTLTPNERLRLFEWINRNSRFNPDQEDWALFNARFDPANQYQIRANYQGKEEVIDGFKRKD